MDTYIHMLVFKVCERKNLSLDNEIYKSMLKIKVKFKVGLFNLNAIYEWLNMYCTSENHDAGMTNNT